MSSKKKTKPGRNPKSNFKGKNAAPPQAANQAKAQSILTVEQVAIVPGLHGGPAIEVPVKLFQVAPEVVADLRARGAEIPQEEAERLHPARKDASQWLKEKRKVLRGTSSAGKLTKRGRSLYLAAVSASKVGEALNGALSEAQRKRLVEAIEDLENLAAELGFDSAAYETKKAQAQMARGK